MHGYGVKTYADGDKYDGEWEYDRKHGHGVYTKADGSKYDGGWKYGEKCRGIGYCKISCTY